MTISVGRIPSFYIMGLTHLRFPLHRFRREQHSLISRLFVVKGPEQAARCGLPVPSIVTQSVA